MICDPTEFMGPEQFRLLIVQKLEAVGNGEVEQTNHHVRFKSGHYAGCEVEFAVVLGLAGKVEINVNGKVLRRVHPEKLGTQRSVWMTCGALIDAFESHRQQVEQIAKEQQDTSACNLFLCNFPLHDTDPFRWSVHDGKIHIDCQAAFGPERFVDFKDLVEMLRLVLKQNSNNIDLGGDVSGGIKAG